MPDDEVRTPPDPQRPGQATPNRGKRRQPPVIDGTAATAVPESAMAPPETPSSAESDVTPPSFTDDQAGDATVHEPSMAAASADLASDSASDRPAGSLAGEAAPNLGAAGEALSSNPPSAGAEPSSTGAEPPARSASAPRRSRAPLVLSIIGLLLVLLLGGILYTLYNPPPDQAVAGVNDEVGALKQRVAALEARPNAVPVNLAPLQDRVAALEKATGQLKGDVSALRSKLDQVSAAADASGNALGVATATPANGSASSQAQNPSQAQSQSQPAVAAAQNEAASQPQTSSPPAVDLGPLQSKVADLGQGLQSLESKVSNLPKVDLEPLTTKVNDLSQSLSSTQQGLSSTQTALAALPKVDLGPLNGKVSDLDKTTATLGGKVSDLEDKTTALSGRVQQIDGRLKPIEADFSAPKANTQVTEARQNGSAAETHAAPIAVTAQAILQAIREGRPFPQALAALQTIGADPKLIAPLQAVADKGAPSKADLLTGFHDNENAMVGPAAPKPAGNVWQRMVSNAEGLVKVRPTGAEPGQDPDAVVSRIGDDLQHGRFDAALKEWQSLPDAGKTASQSWVDKLKARVDAEDAARSIASNAIAALGSGH